MAVDGNERAMDLDTVVDELYGLLPEDFAATRKTRAGEAQAAGTATWRRPSDNSAARPRALWLANVLVRERSVEIAALLELGTALLKAQSDLAGAEMRRAVANGARTWVAPLSDSARRSGL